jgi:hypothetical protein
MWAKPLGSFAAAWFVVVPTRVDWRTREVREKLNINVFAKNFQNIFAITVENPKAAFRFMNYKRMGIFQNIKWNWCLVSFIAL